MIVEVLTDRTCHSQTQVRVDVDLADSHGSSLTELFFRNAYSIRHIAAVFIDHLDVFLRNAGGTVENDREARQTLGNFFQDIETERRRYEDAFLITCALFRFELVSTVAGTDSDR